MRAFAYILALWFEALILGPTLVREALTIVSRFDMILI